MKLISKFALLIVIISILYLLISENLLSTSPLVIVGQLIAILLSIWARRSFKKGQFNIHAEPFEGPLIETGPYKYIRHPMYTSALLIIWSGIFGHLSYVNCIIGLFVTFVIIVRILSEEQFLSARFPEYTEYSRKTKRVIPFLI